MKRRSDEISRVRSIMSGGDTTVQLSAEIKSLEKEEREKLLEDAQLPVVIPTDHALAMKADLGLPWNKFRILRRYSLLDLQVNSNSPRTNIIRRWFKEFKVAIASEGRQRIMANSIVGDTLMAEMGAFTFSIDKGGEEIRKVPFVYYPNFIAKVADMIETHERQVAMISSSLYFYQLHTCQHRSPTGLIWHDGAIPPTELWVKLGGDKGRGSFKFNVQLVNVPKPNSVKTTALLSVFKAGDSPSNLHIALDMYKEHIKEAQGMKMK